MMKANELRIGNAFYQKGSNFVEYATFETFNLLSRKELMIEPVPISENWLLRFGFEKAEQKYFYEKWLFEIHFRSGHLVMCYQGLIDSRFISLKYVHQLQNLYFALTGKELGGF